MAAIVPRVVSRQEMEGRIARFDTLKGASAGLPDMAHPEGARTLINVIGFKPPADEPGAHSPVGQSAAAMAAIPINEGFNLGFAKCKPGTGAFSHYHDTNETFMPLTGQWRFYYNEGPDEAHVDLGPYDVISMPVGIARRFTNITPGDPEAESLLLYVIAGDAPKAEFTPKAMAKIEAHDPAAR